MTGETQVDLRDGTVSYHSSNQFSNKDWSAGKGEDEVILNISPKKFEKPKDQLFIDFFSMYTKQFVDDKSLSKKDQVKVDEVLDFSE
jgi:hypothetical protein